MRATLLLFVPLVAGGLRGALVAQGSGTIPIEPIGVGAVTALGGWALLAASLELFACGGLLRAAGLCLAPLALASWALPEIFSSISNEGIGFGDPRVGFVGLGLAGLGYGIWGRRRLGRSLGRFFHALPFAVLVLAGARMVGGAHGPALARAGALLAVGVLAVVANDRFDRRDDARAGGSSRPVAAVDAALALSGSVVVVAYASAVDPAGWVPLAAFALLVLAYHAPGVRLKLLPGVSYLAEGTGATLAMVYGGSGAFELTGTTALFASFCLGGFGLGSMIKDYKDVDQDAAAGIPTVYTLARSRGWNERWLHIVVSSFPTVGMLAPLVIIALWVDVGCSTALLAPAAVLPQIALLIVRSRRWAVALALIGISLYLLALALTVPPLLVRGSGSC